MDMSIVIPRGATSGKQQDKFMSTPRVEGTTMNLI